ncbi:MAG TPA: sigma-70 family RNA polymerase sigma factor [Rhizomicrobium sp.]
MSGTGQDQRYLQASAEYGEALGRLARGYEANTDRRRDLLQEIHIALWRSFGRFDGRCSTRTWVYRVAHNVGASYVIRRRREKTSALTGLDDLVAPSDTGNPERTTVDRQEFELLLAMIQTLKPADRQIVLLYLEDLDAATIGEVTGLSPGAVATKIHRIKNILARRFEHGGRHDE